MDIHEILAHSQKLLVITGAGCSTGSGIGDYRDDDGEWKRPQPIQHQDFVTRLKWRQRYWARSQVGFPEFMHAQPNTAHQVLNVWEKTGRLQGLITQNVDRLHQRAGQQKVIDLHGRLDEVICLGCNAVTSRHDLQDWLLNHNQALDSTPPKLAPDGDADLVYTDYSTIQVPHCRCCAGILKPNVVFFGDNVPKMRVEEACAWVDAADAMLIVGSSLMVYSSYRFVRRAYARSLPIVAINRGKTRADELFTTKLREECGPALERLRHSFV